MTTHDQCHWNFADERQHYDCVRPVTKNKNWAVQGMQFTDSEGTPWSRERGKLKSMGAAR